MVYFLHPPVENLFSEVKRENDLKSIDAMVLTSYLPAYKRGPYGGIEKLKQLRIEQNPQPAILLSFESFESLFAVPDNGILDEAGTYHLRLPFAPSQFENLLGFVKPLSAANVDAIVQRSCTPHGQLDSFLTRLLIDLQKDPENITLISQKLLNLQKFCAQNWGNWFDNLISQMRACSSKKHYEDLSEVIRVMKQHVPSVIVYHAFEKFAHRSPVDVVNKGLGPLRAMLVSLNSDLINRSYVENYLKSSRSLQDLIQKMISLSHDLGTLSRMFLSMPDDLDRQTKRFIAALAILVNDGSVKLSHANTNSLVGAIDNIIAATDEIIHKGELLKQYLSTWNSNQTD